ncbi:TPA: hypothetical protein ACSP71_004422, partial [Aeromonas hydrophila]
YSKDPAAGKWILSGACGLVAVTMSNSWVISGKSINSAYSDPNETDRSSRQPIGIPNEISRPLRRGMFLVALVSKV